MKELALDVVALAGFGSFLLGLHRIYPPAALIVGGLVVSTVAVLLIRALKVAR